MAFDLLKLLGFGGEKDTTPKKLVVVKQRCPKNHKCPSVGACPVGALSQKGFGAPVVDYKKCINCGKCTRYCFPKALQMQKIAQ